MSWTLAALAAVVGGEIRGNAELRINGAASIEAAREGDLTFVANRTHLSRLEGQTLTAIVVSPADAQDSRLQPFPLLIVKDPQSAFMTIAQQLRPLRPRPARGISPQAVISPTAVIGRDCWIGATAVIGEGVVIGDGCDIHPGAILGDGCQIGNDVIIYPHAVLYADTQVGDRSLIHAGAVLGADGFGYKFVNNAFEKIPQLGWVEIHSDCEIGAGTTVDRGMIGATVIGRGSKIDNMVQIAHNCQIGQHNVFASQVGLAGSCITGDYVRLGGQVGIKDHVTLNSGCSIGAKGGVHKDIPAGETWIGYPATPEAEQKRLVFSLKRVPEMRDTVRALESQVAALTKQLQSLLPPGEQVSDAKAA